MSDTVPEAPVKDEVPNLNLSCRYCDGPLTLDYEWKEAGHTSEWSPVAIECDLTKCAARWDIAGVLLELPQWVKYPDVYSKPEN